MGDGQLVWHYTIDFNVDNIYRDGLIKPSRSCYGETPAVWFSSNQVWEPLANQQILDSRTGKPLGSEHQVNIRKARIGVDRNAAPVRCQGYLEMHDHAVGNLIEALFRDAEWKGSKPAEEWFLSLDPVPRDKWITVEIRRGELWVPYDPSEN
jgi:hypothetical protein